MSDAGGWALAEAGVGWNDVHGFRLSFGDNALDLRFPGSSDGKESACNAGDPGSIPGSARSPEKGMATHSSILAWRIPWTEKPGGLQTMGSQTVGHDGMTKRTHSAS